MYIHFKKEEPFHERLHTYTNKEMQVIGQGRLIQGPTKQSTTYQGVVLDDTITVVIINTPEKNKPMQIPETSGREVAHFSFGDGQRGTIHWMFTKTGEKGLFGIDRTAHWWNISINGESYQMYRAAFGKEGYFYQFNQNWKTVGMIEKDIVIKDFCDSYDVYAVDSEVAKVVLAAAAYIDLCFHNRFLEESARGKETLIVKEPIHSSLAKFDYDFIAKMRKEEGLTN